MARRIRTDAFARHARVAIVLLALSGQDANAQAVINLPAQALGSALSQLAGAMGVNILAPSRLIEGTQVPAISGRLTLEQALDRMLGGTGLKAVRRDDKTYVIEQGAPSPHAGQSTASASSVVLPTISVTAAALGDDFTSSATRTNTPIALIPQSIDVVTQAQIKDRNAQSVSDALVHLPGVSIADFGGVNVKPYIRGFLAPVMVNGHANSIGLSPWLGALGIPIDGVEKIEVLRGADTILAGAMDAGGIVNLVTKQPTATPVRQLTTQVGSFGDVKQAVDLGGPLGSDKRLTYRFVMSGERTGASSYGYDGAKSFYVAPSIAWKSADTEIVLAYRHQAQKVPLTATTLFGPDGLPAKVAWPSAQPGSSLIQSDDIDFDFKHRFAGGVSFESSTSYSRYRERNDNAGYVPLAYVAPQKALFYAPVGDHQVFNWMTDNRVKAAFSTGAVKQTVVAGFQYSVYWDVMRAATGDTTAIGPFPSPVLPPYNGSLGYSSPGRSYFDNVYLQDQISWARLHVTASIARANGWTTGSEAQHAWLPNLGVLYELTDSLSIYASTMRSFYPRRGTVTMSGQTAPPFSGRSVEAGIKLNLLDDRLTVTADVFRAQTANVTQSIPGTDIVTLQGGQVSRGVEASAVGRVLPGLDFSANYAYNNLQQGQGLPRHAGSIWLSYDLQNEQWRGLGGGVGVIAQSSTEVWGTSARLPGQVRTDLSTWYRAKRWSVTFAVKNVFDRLLYNSASASEAFLQPGRLFYLTTRYDI
ncbi:TonB-dependent receptor [Burkholderia cepacia]|uniref:TonB-dependent siderophore receptor n=1 Tax=Burkholderia cepacia TaxID=292 RepID=UPI0013F42DE0|nr:TonB-dependent receptor [Burkholderia cepacia]NHB06578.1 TonB-dependent receptor [Burkholderia cepacia]